MYRCLAVVNYPVGTQSALVLMYRCMAVVIYPVRIHRCLASIGQVSN